MCLHVLSNHFGTFCPHVMQIFSILKEQLLLSIPVPPDSFTSSSSSSSTNAIIEPLIESQLPWNKIGDWSGGNPAMQRGGDLVGEMRAGDTDRWRDTGWHRVLGGGEVKILSNYIQQRLWDIWRSLLLCLVCVQLFAQFKWNEEKHDRKMTQLLPSTSFITLQGSWDYSFKNLHIHPAKPF